MTLTDQYIFSLLSQFFWPFCRIGAFLMVVPIFGARLIPIKIRLLLTIALTVMIAPQLTQTPNIPIFSLAGFLHILSESLTGIVLGFWVHLLFQIGAVAGQFIALQNGMGFSVLIDPMNGTSTTVISQIFLLLTNLVFFILNGHLLVIQSLAESFDVLPFNPLFFNKAVYFSLASSLSWVFEFGLLLSLPAIVALLLVNLSMGVISKVTPQFNIFSVGFPFTILLGLIVLWVFLSQYISIFERSFSDVFLKIQQILLLWKT